MSPSQERENKIIIMRNKPKNKAKKTIKSDPKPPNAKQAQDLEQDIPWTIEAEILTAKRKLINIRLAQLAEEQKIELLLTQRRHQDQFFNLASNLMF